MQEHITVSVSEDDVEKLVTDYVLSRGFSKVNNVDIRIGSKLAGYGMGEYVVHYLERVVCDVER